jgi:hypothetical protein
MKDINEWMVAHKFAKNTFNAQAIFNGLRLYETRRFWERVKRVLIYRKWRDAGESSKTAFAYVLSGKSAPAELFPASPPEA